MAASEIVRVLSRLISKHGLTKGMKKAKNLGFKSKDIKLTVSKLAKKERLQKKSVMEQLRKAASKKMGIEDSLYIGF